MQSIYQRTRGIADYNIMSPDDMNALLFNGFDQALGQETRDRIRLQLENYEYYNGKQHRDESGNLIDAKDMPRPPDLDYDPTRYATNYFKAVIDRKARWQMGGLHGIHVPRKSIDNDVDMVEEDYEPSPEQKRENERAKNYEELLYKLWDENKMRSKLIKAARDRLIADRVVCKIVYNTNTGKMRWVWHPDNEFIPILSDDDFEDMIGCHFVKYVKHEYKNEEVEAVRIQTFRLHNGKTYIREAIYRESDLKLLKEITPSKKEGVKIGKKTYLPMGLDFLPVVTFPVDEILNTFRGDGEIAELRTQNDILNEMNEDAIDSLKFEMFPLTAVLNVPEGTADKMQIAPGAVVEANSPKDGAFPEVRKVESGFRWKEAFKDTYMRVKGAMHEISGLPQIVPQEMNFGGLNTDTLRILFHDIISDTEEHWLAWGYSLAELHEKTIKYMQARVKHAKFDYDKDVVNSIDDYENEMRFQLPLPDNRKDLVSLLGEEILHGLESHSGAMERLGVPNIPAKKQEIENEKLAERRLDDPYGEMTGNVDKGTEGASITQRRNENGELEVLCDRCGGSGISVSETTGEQITCPKCKGTGWFQPRKR